MSKEKMSILKMQNVLQEMFNPEYVKNVFDKAENKNEVHCQVSGELLATLDIEQKEDTDHYVVKLITVRIGVLELLVDIDSNNNTLLPYSSIDELVYRKSPSVEKYENHKFLDLFSKASEI